MAVASRRKEESVLHEVGDLVRFGRAAAKAAPGVPRYGSEVLIYLRGLIIGTTPLMALMCFVMGVTITTFGLYFLRSAGASDYAGLLTGLQNPRGAVVFMFGFVSAAKISCALAAEIGTMRIAEEIDALEVQAVDPMRYTIGARLFAVALYMPIVTPVALLAVNLGGFVNVVHVIGELSAGGFNRFNWGLQTLRDQVFAFVQIFSIGMVHALIGCFYGYRARGGPDAVGRAVARCMVLNLMLIFVIAMVWSQIFYGTNAQLPIGG